MPKRTDETVCPICQKNFSAKGARNEHVAMVHENSGRFKCTGCDKRFYYEPRLKIHEKVHMKNPGTSTFQTPPKSNSDPVIDLKPFKCDQCAYCTNYRYNLKKHQAIHLRASRRSGATQGDTNGSLQAALTVEQPVSHDSNSANYSLRARRKTVNYNDDDVGADEPSVPIKKSKLHEENGREDKLMICDGFLYEEPNGAKDYFGKPGESHESRPAAEEHEMISLSSDDELPSMSNTITSANLTLVYDVEYQAPDESD